MGLKDIQIFKKHQSRLFLLFFGAASFVWLLNSLNDTYTKDVLFKISYTNLDKDLSLGQDSVKEVSLRLSSSGFKLFVLAFSNRQLELDLQGLSIDAQGKYFLKERIQLEQLSGQLGNSVLINGFSNNIPVAINPHKLFKKKVAVHLEGLINPASNYFVSNSKLLPDSVWVRGSQNLLSKIDHVNTLPFRSDLLSVNLDTVLSLKKEQGVSFSPSEIKLEATLKEFSEKVFYKAIHVKDAPSAYEIHFFPNKLAVVVAAPVEILKQITAEDFDLFLSFEALKQGDLELVLPSVQSNNVAIHHLYLKEVTGVEYILTKNP